MRYFKCFLCQGQPTFQVDEKKDSWQESHNHYMTFHFKEAGIDEKQKTDLLM